MKTHLTSYFVKLGKSIQQQWIKHIPYSLFIREIFFSPREIGAVFPSSKQLAKRIAAQINPEAPGLVIELGAGTGAITTALLAHGIQWDRLIIIERAPALVSYLRTQFPQLNIIQGDATELSRLLPLDVKINAIVSSLPLRSLPSKIVLHLSEELEKILQRNSLFVQFTYSASKHYPNLSSHLFCIRSEYVWLNIPPARIDVFHYQ